MVTSRRDAGQLRTLLGLLVAVAALVLVYTMVFHLLMAREGHAYSWFTGVYWTIETMTTLGYGDITFKTDVGMAFSVLVLLSGVVLLFVLVPFTLIQGLYAPWLERREAARTPRSLPATTTNHVLLTSYGPVEAVLIQRLQQYGMPYAVLAQDRPRALELLDRGIQVMIGRVDDAETFRRAGVDRAALVVTTLTDAANANVALSVRQCSATVPILASATQDASLDVLTQAGCNNVIQLGELLGRAMARRIAGQAGRTHVILRLDNLIIAEVTIAGTALVGQTVHGSRLAAHLHLTVVGVWERGEYSPGSASTLLTEGMTLLLSGTQEALDRFDDTFSRTDAPRPRALILGGGRVGRATSRHLATAGIEHTIVEKSHVGVTDPSHYVIGDATDPDVLRSAGLAQATSIAITTHDDDVNAYLTVYCRGRRPDVQILTRSTLEHNVSTLRLAGADFVMSYVPMEANAIFDILRHGNGISLAEGLEVFTVRVPSALAGLSIAQCNLRQHTGCNVLAVRPTGGLAAPPDILVPLSADSDLILIGDRDDERRFFERYQATA
jgi:Trk K+ transport system NAD-binding subunit